MLTIACVLGAIFCKIFKKYPPNARWIRFVSVFVGFPFDMQISLILKIQSLSVWKSSCENFRLLAEAKRHTVWKMIVYGCWFDSILSRDKTLYLDTRALSLPLSLSLSLSYIYSKKNKFKGGDLVLIRLVSKRIQSKCTFIKKNKFKKNICTWILNKKVFQDPSIWSGIILQKGWNRLARALWLSETLTFKKH